MIKVYVVAIEGGEGHGAPERAFATKKLAETFADNERKKQGFAAFNYGVFELTVEGL